MNRSRVSTGTRLVLVFLGLFGAVFAVTGLLVGLPPPAAGGTCGPGQGSEAAIVAFFDPITIGAGPEPPITDAAGRAQWMAFVDQCQTSADNRVLAAFPILVVSAGIVVLGLLLFRRRSGSGVDRHPQVIDPWWSSSPTSPFARPSPYGMPDPGFWAPGGAPAPLPPPPPPWPGSGSP